MQSVNRPACVWLLCYNKHLPMVFSILKTVGESWPFHADYLKWNYKNLRVSFKEANHISKGDACISKRNITGLKA